MLLLELLHPDGTIIMSRYQANLSVDGHEYTKSEGLKSGLHTYSVIQPERRIRDADKGSVWDAIVIGAGYAGLIAARDLVKAGKWKAVKDHTISGC